MQYWKWLTVFSLLTLTLSGCNSSSSNSTAATPTGNNGGGEPALTYDVTVHRTSFGIPHINARDYASMGFGYGYVHAEDNLCVLLDDLITIRGERARYLGRNTRLSPMVPMRRLSIRISSGS